ncbi:MAG: Radical domain protein [Geobacteraceae bacterium]|jgi:radical SAM superfamily enzyme YgiQ (UPF0313 family)|nr:Radical domain protein [Geobacteraceae bacterium]
MNILLISVNREMNPYPVFPIGLAYLAGPLARAGHRLRVLDLCFADDAETAVKQVLKEFVPDAVVVSIRNIDNVTFPASRSYLDEIRSVVGLCRREASVILGGSGFSIMPVELLEKLGGDYGVVGEGEEVLVELVSALSRGESPHCLPGVLVRGNPDYGAARAIERIGSPDRGLFQIDRYKRVGGMANLQTRRGCPFACVYCTYPLIEGSRLRLRPVDEIIAEIRELVDCYGIDYIYFVDDIFNYPIDYAEGLCRAMVFSGVSVNWSAFVNPRFITPNLVRLMVEAGCDAFEFGTDSGSPVMLKNLGKSFGVDDIRTASFLCREQGVDFAHYILFGGPGETKQTVLESFALMDEVAPTAVIGMTGIRIYPGTPLYRLALEENVITEKTDMLEPVFYISGSVRDTLSDLVTVQSMQRKNWVVPGLEINVSDAMLSAIRHFTVRGPLWKLVKRLGRSRVHPMQ